MSSPSSTLVLKTLLTTLLYACLIFKKTDAQFKEWCIADEQTPDDELQKALDWACGKGGADCSKLQAHQPCFLPNTIRDHASYAFNSYYQKYKKQGATCYFNSAAMITDLDPKSFSLKVCSSFFEKISYLGVGVSPGNVPVHHGTNAKAMDRSIRLTELVFRCLICGLGVATAILIGTDTQVKEILSIKKKAKFTDMKALVFLVLANGLAAAYSLAQLARCVAGLVRGNVLFSKPLAWLIFSGDQAMAYLTVAAAAAATQSAMFAKLGQPELEWMKICDMYGKFCNQVGEGIGSAVLVSIIMVFMTWISAFNFFRLYGCNKAKNSTW